jgi:archaellum component FlaF (FlaF/FlaG flagellin family)
MQNDATIIELCLAYIYVGAGVTTITQANITDMRPSNLCGWVTGLIEQVDTSELFLQWQTAYENYYNSMTEEFDDWFDTLSSQLNVNTYIKNFKKRVVLGSGVTGIIPLNMSGYTYSSDDIISVYINGLYAAENVDYFLDTSGSTPEIHVNATASGTEVCIEVLKSKIGFSTLVGSDGSTLAGSDGSDIITG